MIPKRESLSLNERMRTQESQSFKPQLIKIPPMKIQK